MSWHFYRAYKNLPRYLGWGAWRPGIPFHEGYLAHMERRQPFYGIDREFGSYGRVTQRNFPNFFKPERQQKIELKTLLLNYIRENF